MLLSASAAGAAAAPNPDPYAGVSLSGVYSSETLLAESEDLDGSALVARGYAGLRFNPRGNSTRVQLASNYFGYFDRKDRWSNSFEAEQELRLGRNTAFSIEGSAASNVLTLERLSTDQAAVAARLRIEPGNHRVTFGAGTRRRWYDDSAATSWAPFLEAEYRYRLGSWHSLAFESRLERINSNLDTLDYDRLSLSAFYTRPLGRHTRVRGGLTHRRWTWDERFTPSGDQRRERLWLPQLSLTQVLGGNVDLEFDAQRVIRRSNDKSFNRNGTRLAATLRKTF
ncbi:MAG: hypothetical protein ABIS23_04545 [Sphingomicrobium sp.]